MNRIGYWMLTGVSCVACGCLAVGSYNVGVAAIAERWNGRRWRLARLPGRHHRAAQRVLHFSRMRRRIRPGPAAVA